MTASRSCSPPISSCDLSSGSTTRPTPRQRSGTLSDLVEWRRGRAASGLFAGDEGWSGFGTGSTSSGESASGSDSAYGTLDEADSDQGGASGAECRGWKAAGGGLSSRLRKRGTRSRSVGDQIFHWPVVPAALEVQSTGAPVFPVQVDIDYDADTSFDSVESFASTTAESSVRSSPEPSECDFELTNNVTTRKEKRRRLMHRSLDLDDFTAFPALSRRHTVPRRRHKLRSTSISISIVSPSLDVSLPHRNESSPSSSPLSSLPTLPPLTLAAAILSLTLSLLSQLSPIALLPASPVHLLHTRNYALLEYINAFLSPFLVHGSTSALALAAANLASLKSIEEEAFTRRGATVKAVVVSGMWVAIVALRVLLSWVFGRVLGWAHPEWFATSAIHEVGSGLAPVLLAISIVRAYSVNISTSSPSLLQLALLAANFCTPIEQGGSGAWFALSGVVVGLAVCAVLFAVEQVAPSRPSSSRPTKRSHSLPRSSPLYFGPLLAFLLLPLLATFAPVTPSLSPAALDASFAKLHPRQPHLFTVLLMTAPRPGNPDYLVQTIESWLDALPEPSLDSSRNSSIDRVRLIVYTHFLTHEIFDSARSLFTTHPTYAAKSAQYVEWHRDPRSANRLDQRLHVARGLEYAATSGGSSAYVMLAEDDFPLCPDGGEEGSDRRSKRGQWASTWEELQRVLLATNSAMPDFPSLTSTTASSLAPMSLLEQESTAGHCGLFVATGGSGLAMRGFIAAKLPALLLGEHDPHGTDRDERASRGEFSVKHEDEGADTPDLVIQDCLRGRLPECSVCEAPRQESVWELKWAREFPVGSARNPGGGGVRGDRWGKSGLAGTERLMQHHLGYNASTLPGRKYGKEEWACGWRQPFNGEPDVLTV